MIEEKTLKRIAMLGTIVGMLFLYFYADKVEPRLPEQLELAKLQDPIRIKGVVQQLQVTPKATFFTLEGERIENTPVIFFPKESVFLEEGDYVELEGIIEEYKGEKEIIASKITKR